MDEEELLLSSGNILSYSKSRTDPLLKPVDLELKAARGGETPRREESLALSIRALRLTVHRRRFSSVSLYDAALANLTPCHQSLL